ncbi:hypothetical protein BC938DRAFT_470981 [Jimgerdemannia flammicorona]|uniref:UvrD-like helicase ATP-binding domain-containing protein n=1 Tax=Jimgerdemannia flammicorona TaxID=994334 RepID=A0A433Q977_9FUNG|nr:hypothetical protein BC938DRAFT_470981 [Jimgerdemannia flammicorona]
MAYGNSFNDLDAPDWGFAILQAIKRSGYHGVNLHQIYVDECQDNNMCDYAVLIKLISDPNGLFFAGDTAQPVARGSLFRFADLSSFVFRHEHQHPSVLAGHRKPVQLRLSQLTTNFRSHDGILTRQTSFSCQLLHHSFPSTVDVLDKEHGIVDGSKPMFFSDFTANRFLSLFCFGESSDQTIEFGAEQCGLCQIVKVFAKGLEFNDTLLYNFWEDSPAWKVVLSTIEESDNQRYPQFDHKKHAILSDELKQLYVAVTRARSHPWIFDENVECSEPMKKVWLSNGLVKVVNKSDELLFLGTKSSDAEWDKQGRNLFERQQYEHAVFCFTKSNNQAARELSEAYMLLDNARRLVSQLAGQNDIKDAFRPSGAADCYQFVKMYREAGQRFKRAMMLQQAVLAFKAGGYFDELVDILCSEPNVVAFDVSNKVLDDIVKYYLEDNKLQRRVDLYNKSKNNSIKTGNVLRSLDRLQDAAELYAKNQEYVAKRNGVSTWLLFDISQPQLVS